MTDPDQHDEVLRTTSAECELHKFHIPSSHQNHIHHIWPLGEGGPNVKENTIVVCPTGHANIHVILHEMKIMRGHVTYNSYLRQFSFQERRVAKLGWDRMQRKAL